MAGVIGSGWGWGDCNSPSTIFVWRVSRRQRRRREALLLVLHGHKDGLWNLPRERHKIGNTATPITYRKHLHTTPRVSDQNGWIVCDLLVTVDRLTGEIGEGEWVMDVSQTAVAFAGCQHQVQSGKDNVCV
jgi:hypothetical protein